MNWHEVLKRFCSTEETRSLLQEPWVANGKTIATDGRRLIILDVEIEGVDSDTTGRPTPEGIERIMSGFALANYGPLPPGMLELRACDHLRHEGDDEDPMLCKECRGSGGVLYDCQRMAGQIEIECPVCEGAGYGVEQCTRCDGRGQYALLNGVPIQKVPHGPVHLRADFVAAIADLPGVELEMPATEQRVIHFRFDGGRGAMTAMLKEG